MNRIRSVSIGLVTGTALLLSLGGTLEAQNTAKAGGTGGTSYNIKCQDGFVLVGLRVTYGSWIDWIKGFCQSIDIGNGSWMDSGMLDGVGGSGLGTTKAFLCPSGYAVKGFRGKAGWYVNSMILTCRKLGPSARTQSESKDLEKAGGSDGTAYGPHACGDAKPAIGMYGKAGQYIDSFGLICGYLMPTVPSLVAPSSGVDVTTKRPTFDWDAAARITKPYQICINLSSGAGCSISGTIKATINPPTTQWTPSSDLPFTRGDVVYWRIEACNDNGCKSTSKSFRFMP